MPLTEVDERVAPPVIEFQLRIANQMPMQSVDHVVGEFCVDGRLVVLAGAAVGPIAARNQQTPENGPPRIREIRTSEELLGVLSVRNVRSRSPG